MGRTVIVAYTPKDGMENQLLAVVLKHQKVLQTHNLVTDKPAYAMRAADGSVLKVFEWRSADAITQAHNTPAVQDSWNEFGDVCQYTPIAKLAESQNMFAEFDTIDL